MVALGCMLSSEEHPPNNLVSFARQGEEAGFTFALISDHFHPWIDAQGQSPFVWSVLGGIARETRRLQLGTSVTCPTTRIHPAIIAQAAATVACMMPGRFFLGLGSGEALNEHILGDRWPAYERRAAMLEEAIDVIQMLWEGESTTYYGTHYVVENARIYTLPDEPPPIMIAAAGSSSARLASQFGDGLISTAPSTEVIDTFTASGDPTRPRYGLMKVCYDEDPASARATAYRLWPTTALHGELGQELPTPKHFEQAARSVTEADVAEQVVCGNDPAEHLAQIRAFVDAGFDHVCIHQIGDDQAGFFRFYQDHIFPEFN